ncbi:MAG: protein translocase subunit SecD [Acidobacteria bacterium]|nr:MAG: protein translocase subunit SecD [Acidobacteriota bacterium]
MSATLKWRLILIAAVVVVALFQAWPRPGKPILNMHLGLDLRGGSHLLLEVVTDDAVKAETDLTATRTGERLRDAGFPDARAASTSTTEFEVSGIPADRLQEALSVIQEELARWKPHIEGDVIKASMPPREEEAAREQAVLQALTTITNRIDQFGVAEPVIQRVGGGEGNRILLQLPGVEDPARVKRSIQTQARLELRLAYYKDGDGPFRGESPEDVLAQLGGTLPPGVEILPAVKREDPSAPPVIDSYWAVEKTAVITGNDLQSAFRQTTRWGENAVGFRLKVAAADRFARFTRKNIDRIMPIILDGKILSAPVIRSEISVNGQISGAFTYEEAEDLARNLRAGALPARVRTIEERTVGPSLGRDSIIAGARAIVLGFLLVVGFMLVYYKRAGLNAVIALVLNLLLVAALMSALDATLTLPGIAGFILTVGMAVDANVLIFERIREELRSGKTIKGALDGGFSKALSAIIDANVTTLIAAVFLFNYGTGPVKGFAATLSIGIVASMFTAIFVSRTLFDWSLSRQTTPRLSI